MDIIDVVLARMMTPQGQVETYAQMARTAASNASQAASDASTAITRANAAVEAAEQVTDIILVQDEYPASAGTKIWINPEEGDAIQIPTTDDLIEEINKIALELYTSNSTSYISKALRLTYPDSSSYKQLDNIVKYYKSLGQNEDGTMTQKAITDAIAGSGGGGGSTNLGPENDGKIVTVGSDGFIIPSDINEIDLINLLVNDGSYTYKDAVGLDIDYTNKSFVRKHAAENLSPGQQFNKFLMYGGRTRCNVADNGTITAFYGQSSYRDDGSNGQVMIYQPKFYYYRNPIKMTDGTIGKIVNQEQILVSSTKYVNFKLHPLFIDENGNELEYVLLSAYEGSYYDASSNSYITDDSGTIDFSADKLCSIAGVKPVSGKDNALTTTSAEQLAQNRGSHWHITNIAAESALQMLFMSEYGSLNGQAELEKGISQITGSSTYNAASQTGSTANLGNSTGAAESTTNIINGVTTVYNTNGTRAITYRGMENPWGNIWRFVGGLNISGNINQKGGIPYVCEDFNYSNTITNKYHSVGFCLPTEGGWGSALGYGDSQYDWILMPVDISSGNSALPIGDYIWVTPRLNAVNSISIGGLNTHDDKNGLFYYAADQDIESHSRTQSARLMYIPSASQSNYQTNITAWKTVMGVD